MNSHKWMKMVLKGQNILLTLPAYKSTTKQRTYVDWWCEKHALLTEMILSVLFLTIVIPVHFLEMFLSLGVLAWWVWL